MNFINTNFDFIRNLLLKFKNSLDNYPVRTLFFLHLLTIAFLILILKIILHRPDSFFLEDDGYYLMGKDFFYGKSDLSHRFRTPGIPLILSFLNFFPASLHPYLRVLLSELLTCCNIYLVFKIFSTIFSKNIIIWGILFSIFNPLYIWWCCLRSAPEIYLTTILGLIIFISLNLLKVQKCKYLLALLIIFPMSLLIKPILILIPIFLSVYFLRHKKNKLSLYLFALVFICFILFKLLIDFTKTPEGASYGENVIMFDAFFTESFMKTGQLGFYQGGGELPEANSNTEYIYKNIKEWTTEYSSKNGGSDLLTMNFEFVKEKPWITLLSKTLNPVYFISLTDSTKKTIMMFVINLPIVLIFFSNFNKTKKVFPEQMYLLIYILLGFYSPYFLSTSIARYFIPALFYMSVLTGVSMKNGNKLFLIFKK